MQTEQLITLVQDALDNLKARDIEIIDVQGRSSITDFMIIASGTSRRHVVSIAEEVIDKVKAAGLLPVGSEGLNDGEWVLVDLGELVVHVMMPDARSFYDLERLWRFDSPAEKNED